MAYGKKFKWQNPNVKSNPKPQCQNVFQNDQIFICKYSGSGFSAASDRWSGQFDRKRDSSVVESHTRVQGCFCFHQLTLNREPWNFEPLNGYVFFSIWNLGFDLCHSNAFYLHIWTLLGVVVDSYDGDFSWFSSMICFKMKVLYYVKYKLSSFIKIYISLCASL